MQKQYMVLISAILALSLSGTFMFYHISVLRPPQVSTMTITGSGETIAEPDRVKISLGIITQAKEAEVASAENPDILGLSQTSSRGRYIEKSD